MNARCAAALLAAALLFPGHVAALPARPEGPVADLANLLDAQTTEALDGLIRQTRDAHGAVLVVATVPSLEGSTVEDYAVRLFKAWGIGDKDRNNGVLLLVAPTEHKVKIEVGYGLEGTLPDGRCGEIIRDEIVPAFKRGAPAEGVLAGAKAIAAAVAGESASQTEPESGGDFSLDVVAGIVVGVAAAFIVGLSIGWFERGHRWSLLVTAAGVVAVLAGAWLAWQALSHLFAFLIGAGAAGEHIGSGRYIRTRRVSGGGWTSGGFGGWSGGGGGFGGGGFGGFGGGSSGGGGASGSW